MPWTALHPPRYSSNWKAFVEDFPLDIWFLILFGAKFANAPMAFLAVRISTMTTRISRFTVWPTLTSDYSYEVSSITQCRYMVSVLGKADSRWKLPGSSRLWMVRDGLFHNWEFRRLNYCPLLWSSQEPENLYPRSMFESFGGIRTRWYLLTSCSDHWWDHEALWWIYLVNTKCYQNNWTSKDCLTVTHKAEADLLDKGRASTVHQGANYTSLHNLARHATHSSETLDVAAESLASIIGQHDVFSQSGWSCPGLDAVTLCQTRQHLGFQMQVLRSLKARSKANESRLRNEIDLVCPWVSNFLKLHLTKARLSMSLPSMTTGWL